MEIHVQKCHRCSKKIDGKNVKNVAFYNCKFKFKGMTKDRNFVESEMNSTGEGDYVTFNEEHP